MTALLIDPLVSLDLIERPVLNAMLVEWHHQHGPIERPIFKSPVDVGLRHQGRLVAVIACDTLIRTTQGFSRSQACEVSRVCAAAPGMCSSALRLWRHFVYPTIVAAWGTPWVISYQDATRHEGNLYRRDGWALIGCSRGGADSRAVAGTVRVRRRLIWAWNADKVALAERRRLAAVERPSWPNWARDAAKGRLS